jgi:hypothetical protein
MTKAVKAIAATPLVAVVVVKYNLYLFEASQDQKYPLKIFVAETTSTMINSPLLLLLHLDVHHKDYKTPCPVLYHQDKHPPGPLLVDTHAPLATMPTSKDFVDVVVVVVGNHNNHKNKVVHAEKLPGTAGIVVALKEA